jgi:hypothetical protein
MEYVEETYVSDSTLVHTACSLIEHLIFSWTFDLIPLIPSIPYLI